MEPILKFLILSSLFITSIHATTSRNENEVAENLSQNLSRHGHNVARIHFFLHDALSGPNATVLEVARSQITSNSSTRFGTVLAVDDLFTAEPDRNSQRLGRAQGLIAFTDLHASALAMYLNFVFTAGEFNGSSFSMLGRNSVYSRDRELPIVGGTGMFRMAGGYCITSTYSYDRAEDYAVLEYTAYVLYGH